MGKKLDEEEIESAIKQDSNTMFDTCCFCGGTEEGQVMNEVDDDTFDVCCDECQSEQESYDAWIEENVIKFKDGYGTQDAQYGNRLKTDKDLYKYFIKEFVIQK